MYTIVILQAQTRGKDDFESIQVRKYMQQSCMSRRQRRKATSFLTGWHAPYLYLCVTSPYRLPRCNSIQSGRSGIRYIE